MYNYILYIKINNLKPFLTFIFQFYWEDLKDNRREVKERFDAQVFSFHLFAITTKLSTKIGRNKIKLFALNKEFIQCRSKVNVII